MDTFSGEVGPACTADAACIARVYVEAWQDTYPGIVPDALLRAMTLCGQTARWTSAIARHEAVLVARDGVHGIVGMASLGRARDTALGQDGEIYTLYVDPAFYGCGTGRALMAAAFGELRRRGFSSCIVWAHAKNPARYFYERLGGRLVGERTGWLMGEAVREVGFGWATLAAATPSAAG